MQKQQVSLADALLRRKELQGKVDQLKHIKDNQLNEMVVQRIKVTDGVDEIRARVPYLTVTQVTQAYDWHARQLRLIDSAIQQANWTTQIAVDTSTFDDFVAV
jgi:hypothetical protein